MGKPTGFKEKRRQTQPRIPVAERIRSSREFYRDWTEQEARDQGSRCMSCSVPFCHTGCPLGNLIPDWNDLVYRGRWREALAALHSTNNFPEFTGRICPAPCEASCILAINEEPVTIEQIERAIVDRGWKEGWITPQPPQTRTGKRVAIVGSGPAALAAAQQLNRAGHLVTVFERDDRIGGLLRLGIPDFKLEKGIVDRRVDQLTAEGIIFKTRVTVGSDVAAQTLVKEYDAVLLAGGSTVPRDLNVEGRDLSDVHYAMEYLTQQNRVNAGEDIDPAQKITAEGKRVVILGGGDTGADCLGTAHRQGAEIVHQFELLPEPPKERRSDNPWPQWPLVLTTSAAHEEGGVRDYDIMTKRLSGSNGRVERLHGVRLEWGPPDDTGRPSPREIPGASSRSRPSLCSWPWGSSTPSRAECSRSLAWTLTRAAT